MLSLLRNWLDKQRLVTVQRRIFNENTNHFRYKGMLMPHTNQFFNKLAKKIAVKIVEYIMSHRYEEEVEFERIIVNFDPTVSHRTQTFTFYAVVELPDETKTFDVPFRTTALSVLNDTTFMPLPLLEPTQYNKLGEFYAVELDLPLTYFVNRMLKNETFKKRVINDNTHFEDELSKANVQYYLGYGRWDST